MEGLPELSKLKQLLVVLLMLTRKAAMTSEVAMTSEAMTSEAMTSEAMTSEAKIKIVKEHIESFPKYRSHYSRQDNPNRSYPSPFLSLSKMYALYKEKCTEDDQVSEWVCRKIFNTEYNLYFGR